MSDLDCQRSLIPLPSLALKDCTSSISNDKMPNLICVIGVTGNQGGAVAQRFLKDPNFEVRGLTRDPASEKARQLAAQGIEIVQAELNNVQSLVNAFKGASLIFSVTQYWEPFFRPDCRQEAEAQGISCRKYAYDVEYQQGRNIADAAATVVDSLESNGFLVSTLSHAGKCSRGAIKEAYHFDSKANVFPRYVDERYPELAAKMSCIQTGCYMTSYKLLPTSWYAKVGQPHITWVVAHSQLTRCVAATRR